MSRLGIDLDGVCYDFTAEVRKWIHKSTGKPMLEMPRQTRWHFAEDWGLTSAELDDLVSDGIDAGEIWWKGDPIKGTVVSLNRLAEDHEIVIVTARFWGGSDHTDATEYWLRYSGIPYDRLIVTKDKAAVDIDLLLDDAPHNLDACAAVGIEAVMWDTTYNQDAIGTRVYSWPDFEAYLAKAKL